MQEIREMDYGGIVLFTGGLILFLLGLSWGGTLYPWSSAHVIATLVVGILTLIGFVFYGRVIHLCICAVKLTEL